jgi:hypothetical protein
MIQKTKITNMTGKGRNVTWIGKRGQWLDGYETAIVDGAYPTACRNDATANLMEEEIKAGMIRISLITDIATEQPDDAVLVAAAPVAGAGSAPEVVVDPEPAAEEVDSGVEETDAEKLTRIARGDSLQDEIQGELAQQVSEQPFVKVDPNQKQQTIALDGEQPEVPKTKPMFGQEQVPETQADSSGPIKENVVTVQDDGSVKETPVKAAPARKRTAPSKGQAKKATKAAPKGQAKKATKAKPKGQAKKATKAAPKGRAKKATKTTTKGRKPAGGRKKTSK